MDFAAMTADEWRLWPEREDVTFLKQTAVGSYDEYRLSFSPGGAAKRRAITWKEMTASAGAYTSQDKAWLIPAANLPGGVLPAPGDIVRDSADVDWTVGDVTVGKFGNTHKCVCRALAIVNALSATGTLTRPSNAQDSAGRMSLATYSTVGTVACRVQPQDSSAGDVFDARRTIVRKYAAYLATPLAVLAKDVFTVGGQAYTVLGFRNPERIWDLQSLDLELLP